MIYIPICHKETWALVFLSVSAMVWGCEFVPRLCREGHQAKKDCRKFQASLLAVVNSAEESSQKKTTKICHEKHRKINKSINNCSTLNNLLNRFQHDADELHNVLLVCISW